MQNTAQIVIRFAIWALLLIKCECRPWKIALRFEWLNFEEAPYKEGESLGDWFQLPLTRRPGYNSLKADPPGPGLMRFA